MKVNVLALSLIGLILGHALLLTSWAVSAPSDPSLQVAFIELNSDVAKLDDSLDALPHYDWPSAYSLLIDRVRRSVWNTYLLDLDHDASRWKNAPPRDSLLACPECFPVRESLHVLAWRTLISTSSSRDSLRECVVLVRYVHPKGGARSLLVVLDAACDADGCGSWTLALPHVTVTPSPTVRDPRHNDRGLKPQEPSRRVVSYEDMAVAEYARPPRERDIVNFLRRLDTFRSDHGAQYPSFVDERNNGVDRKAYVYFDGAVRVNTWKRVIGETPTIFFPNGK